MKRECIVTLLEYWSSKRVCKQPELNPLLATSFMPARSLARVNIPPLLDCLLWSFRCDDHPLRLFSISAPHFCDCILRGSQWSSWWVKFLCQCVSGGSSISWYFPSLKKIDGFLPVADALSCFQFRHLAPRGDLAATPTPPNRREALIVTL